MSVGTFTCSTVRDTRAATLSSYLLQCILPSIPQVILFYNTILRSSKLLPHLQQLIHNLGSFQNQNITQEPKSFTSPALLINSSLQDCSAEPQELLSHP